MKRLSQVCLIAAVLTASFTALVAEQAKTPAAVLLEKGIYTEQTKGDVDAAIEIYKKIIADESSDRNSLARAHLALVVCYKGLDEKACNRHLNIILTEFADQKDVIDVVRRYTAYKVEKNLDEPGGLNKYLTADAMKYIFSNYLKACERASKLQRICEARFYLVDTDAVLHTGGVVSVLKPNKDALEYSFPIYGNQRPYINLFDADGKQQPSTVLDMGNYTTNPFSGMASNEYAILWARPAALPQDRPAVLTYLDVDTKQLYPSSGKFEVNTRSFQPKRRLITSFVIMPPNLEYDSTTGSAIGNGGFNGYRIFIFEQTASENTSTNVTVYLKDRRPVLVDTSLQDFDNNVDPATKTISVKFDRPMTDKSWSFTGGGETFPEITRGPAYDRSRRTCTLGVKLEAGKVYWVGINSPSHKNFKSAEGIPTARYVLLFATKGKDGKPTEIPESLRKSAMEINDKAWRPEPVKKSSGALGMSPAMPLGMGMSSDNGGQAAPAGLAAGAGMGFGGGFGMPGGSVSMGRDGIQVTGSGNSSVSLGSDGIQVNMPGKGSVSLNDDGISVTRGDEKVASAGPNASNVIVAAEKSQPKQTPPAEEQLSEVEKVGKLKMQCKILQVEMSQALNAMRFESENQTFQHLGRVENMAHEISQSYDDKVLRQLMDDIKMRVMDTMAMGKGLDVKGFDMLATNWAMLVDVYAESFTELFKQERFADPELAQARKINQQWYKAWEAFKSLDMLLEAIYTVDSYLDFKTEAEAHNLLLKAKGDDAEKVRTKLAESKRAWEKNRQLSSEAAKVAEQLAAFEHSMLVRQYGNMLLDYLKDARLAYDSDRANEAISLLMQMGSMRESVYKAVVAEFEDAHVENVKERALKLPFDTY